MTRRKLFYGILTVLAVFIVGVLGVSATWPVINVVETGKTPEYADVLPQYYATDAQRVWDEALGTAQTIKRWKVVAEDRTKRTIRVERTTRVFGFVDDIEIRVEPVTEFATRVSLRSASRVGHSDFGQNARNIREYYAELDRRIGALAFDPRAEQP